MYQYQQTHRYFTQVAHGLEPLGTEELTALGAQNIEAAYRGLYFDADAATLYRITYCARLITRVLAPLLTFDCHSTKYLYKTARTIPWADFLTQDQTFAVFSNVANSQINHSKYAALCLKDAIVDQFRDNTGERPSIERQTPDLWLHLRILNDRAIISVDAAGGSLHRRGYRQDALEAPMQETVAAAVIRMSGWEGERPLYDPMCGSGTLLAEALMHYCHIPAAYYRNQFGFERLPDYDVVAWQSVKAEADGKIRPLPEGLISGSDRSREAIEIARSNLDRLPDGHQVHLKTVDFRDLGALHNVAIVCNPPYGVRLEKKQDLGAFYKSLGDFLKQHCSGSSAYLYFGKREWMKHIGLRPTWKKPLVNGALEGRLALYEMY